MSCLLCEERKIEIERILKGYRIDKATFTKDKKYYRKIIKIMGAVCLILTLELILTLTYGKEGITMGLELIQKILA